MTEGWWKYAKPGDKVVCVDDREHAFSKPGCGYRAGLDGLATGTVYTVRHVGPETVGPHAGEIFIWIREIQRPPYDAGYNPARFRPLQTKSTETGMAILKAILNGAPVKEDA